MCLQRHIMVLRTKKTIDMHNNRGKQLDRFIIIFFTLCFFNMVSLTLLVFPLYKYLCSLGESSIIFFQNGLEEEFLGSRVFFQDIFSVWRVDVKTPIFYISRLYNNNLFYNTVCCEESCNSFIFDLYEDEGSMSIAYRMSGYECYYSRYQLFDAFLYARESIKDFFSVDYFFLSLLKI